MNQDDTKKHVHIIPKFKDEPPHEETVNCWCGPEICNEDDVESGVAAPVWSHNRKGYQ